MANDKTPRFVVARGGRRTSADCGVPTDQQQEHSGRTAIPVTWAEVYAAKLRLVTDRKQGKTSPDWVHELAHLTEG